MFLWNGSLRSSTKVGPRRYTSHVKFTLAIALLLTARHGFAAPGLSEADEARVGHILAGKVTTLRGTAPTPQTERIENYLQTVGDRVAAKVPRQVRFHFHFDPEPGFKSAFALPGGEIFVGGGILAFLDSEDQLAVILGHEIGHVALNQCQARLVSILAEQHLSPADAEKLNVESFFGSYGHDGELAADREGVKLAASAGYSPRSVVRLLETFLFLGERSPHTPNDSKAMLLERIDQIRFLIEREKLSLPSSEKPLMLP